MDNMINSVPKRTLPGWRCRIVVCLSAGGNQPSDEPGIHGHVRGCNCRCAAGRCQLEQSAIGQPMESSSTAPQLNFIPPGH